MHDRVVRSDKSVIGQLSSFGGSGFTVSGSGFIVDAELGYILTATHVVADVERDSITVTYRDGVIEEAVWVAKEPDADISLLRGTQTGFPSLQVPSDIEEALAESRGGVIADRIRKLMAVSGQDGAYGETLSLTVDNAGWQNITINTPGEPGMSGGPLVDPCGNLVGIVSLGINGPDGTLTAIVLDQSRLAALMANPTLTPLPPTPAPASTPVSPAQQKWTQYQNSEYGYAVDVAPGWTTEQLNDGGVILDSPYWDAQFVVFPLEKPGYTLEAFVDETLEFRRNESKVLFEYLFREEDFISGLRATAILYRSQITEAYCIDNVLEVFILNGFQGFDLLSSSCDDRLEFNSEDLATMLNSFRITGAKAAIPIPKPLSGLNWIERHQHQYGTLPQYPDWLIPLFPGREGDTISKIHTMSYVPNVGQWCNDMLPGQRRMLLEFYEWQGGSAMDLIKKMASGAPPPTRSADYYLLRCPPEGGLP